MSDSDEDPPAPYFSLQLQHEKLRSTIDSQIEDAKHFDMKATGILRASFAFSAVVAAGIYYIARLGPSNDISGLDNPLTYIGLGMGLISMVCSVGTITHTKIESELNPGDIDTQAKFGEFALLRTAVEVYPKYIDRNSSRLATDKTLLATSQYTLVFAVLSIVASVLSFLNGRDFGFLATLALTFTFGALFGIIVVLITLSILAEE